jgi:outer membrane lipoprotein-sorting protein
MKNKTASIAVVLIASIGTSFTPAKTGLEIAKSAEEADNGWVSLSNILTMTLTNRKGQKTTRQMHGYFKEVEGDGDMSMTIFDTPKDVKGTANMVFTHKTGDDDQWLYLPSIDRVKRISSSNKSGPFMGSEFAFEDLSSQELEKYTYNFLSKESMNGEDCYKLERFPVIKSSGYKRNIIWYNQANYRVEKIEFYDRKDALLKTLTYSDFKLYLSNYWRPNTMKMVNHQNGKETLLEFSEITFGVEISDADFSQNALKRAK